MAEEEELQRRRRATTENFLDQLEQSMLVQHENGITKYPKAKEFYDKAHNKLIEAHTEMQRPIFTFDYAKFDQLAREAQMEFDQSINSTPFLWRFHYVYGYSYLIIYLVLIALVFLEFFKGFLKLPKIPVIEVPTWAMLFGIIGGALRGIVWIRDNSVTYKIRKSWGTYLIVPPSIGATLGIIAYLIHEIFHTHPGAMLFCLLGGYSSEFIFRHLNRMFTHE